MMWRPVTMALLLGGLLFAACGGGDSGSPTATAPIEPTATPVPTATPAADRTGIAEIDAVLDALFSGDEQAVRSLIRFTAVECEAEPVGLGSPPQCPESVADGTPIDVFPWSSCEGTFVFPEAIDATVMTLAEPGAVLVAVYDAEGKTWPPAAFVAVYNRVGDPRRADIAYAVSITDGRVVGIHVGCGMTPERYAEFFDLPDPLFVPPTPTPAANRTGVIPLDAFLDALDAGDVGKLRKFVRYSGVPCTTTPGLGGPPLCMEGEEGTLVEVLPIHTCELEYHRRSEIDWALEGLVERTPLYAVYRTDDGYSIVLTRTLGGMRVGAAVAFEERNMTEIWFGCGSSPEELVEELGLEDAVLPPPADRTGIPEVDAVLEAVLSHDPEAVRPLIGFETVTCIGPTPGSLGALFCEEDETPGTRVEALRAAQCEGHYIRADEMNQALESMTDATVKLYAVARTDEGHRAVFSRLVGPNRETAAGYAVLIEEGRVTFVDFGCEDTAEELVERVPPESFVLPPPTPASSN